MRDTQATFAGGEVTPALYGRTDLQKYKTALKAARNVNIIPQGGARNRPGTKFIAKAGDSTNPVRLIPFIASTTQAYILELGNFYARFYTQDAQVNIGSATAWVTATNYSVGNYVTESGTIYYCLISHTSGVFATDLAAGKWVAQTIYQIPTPWAAADIFQLRFAQSADVMYFAHPDYPPQLLTFNSSANWVMTAFPFTNGPFMLRNTDLSKTITPSSIVAPTGNFNVASVFIYNGPGYTGRVVINTTTSPAGGWSAYVGAMITLAGLTGNVSIYNGLTFSVSDLSGATYLVLADANNSAVPIVSDVSGSPWSIGAGVVTAATAGVTLNASQAIFNVGQINGLFQIVYTISAQTLSPALTGANQQSATVRCGSTYSIITNGGWTGSIAVQVSTDNSLTWTTIQTFQSTGNNNFTTSGATGFSQCLIRVVSQGTAGFNPVGSPAWAGTMNGILTTTSFDWVTTVKIIAYTSPTIVAASVLTNPGEGSGLGGTTATAQWSEGSWSDFRGFPTCVTFYQDRSAWASTRSEPNTVWFSKTSSYADFGVSAPLVDSDGFSVVLASRQLNSVNFLIPMPQALIAGSGDMAFGLAPGSNGIFSATSVSQTPMDHRGSFNLEPVVVGNEIILVQQMGTVIRNLIFQLAVNGFMGDNISVASQHMFTGYTLKAWAYQQEPDSIIWAVRSDGVLLSCTYDRAQEMNAWTRHDTAGGLYESVACIPNIALGINEIWFVVNRAGIRYIEALRPRDQGTVPSAQWFVDAGVQYNGAPATVISGIPFPDGTVVAVLADGNVVSGLTVTVGAITLAAEASIVTVGIPMVWDVGLLDIEVAQNQKGSLQGQRVKMPRAKIRCWNSRSGYISTTPPASSTGLTDTDGGSFDALFDIMQRDPATNFDTPLPLVTGIVDATLASGYQYGAGICLRGVDPLPFALLDVLPVVVPGGD